MSEIIKSIPNETATDRGLWDGINSKADASTNEFEQNPDDSVDITAKFDDDKAQAIEQTLEPSLEVNHSTAEQHETELTPESYEKFAKKYFSELLDALENPVNADPANQQAITDQIIITAQLLVDADDDNFIPNPPKAVFDHLAKSYLHTADDDRGRDQTTNADRNQRLASSISQLESSFKDYAGIKTESLTSSPSDVLRSDILQ